MPNAVYMVRVTISAGAVLGWAESHFTLYHFNISGGSAGSGRPLPAPLATGHLYCRCNNAAIFEVYLFKFAFGGGLLLSLNPALKTYTFPIRGMECPPPTDRPLSTSETTTNNLTEEAAGVHAAGA